MPEPLLCETVTGRTMGEVLRLRDASPADMVEVRLDGVDRPDGRAAVAGRRRPVIVTCRPRWEGGQFDGSEEERQRVLTEAFRAGAEFVDVEAQASFVAELARMRRGDRGLILSRHFFERPPADLAGVADAMRARGGEVIKLAVQVTHLAELVPLFELGDRLTHDERGGDTGHVLIGMGPCGIPSRILGHRLGNRWIYAGPEVAPGQLPLHRLVDEFHVRRIGPETQLFGVTGNPVLHSLSPVMHNAGFAALGFPAVYLPLQAASVQDFVAFARAIGLRGASITAPFKVGMLDHVTVLDPVAQRVGAINTLVVEGDRWYGANTDVDGFLAPLAGRMRLRGTRAAILGAGGAARAVAVALSRQGAQVTVCARRPEAAAEVARLAGNARVASVPPAPGSWDVLINTTPVGSLGEPGNPMAGQPLTGEIVFDLIYVPSETQLLAQARAEGCMVIGGLEMLVAQAERQFQLWTGERPPAGLFNRVASRALPGTVPPVQEGIS